MNGNAIHDAERDEWRSAVRGLNELQRVTACGHTVRPAEQPCCPDCGDGVDL